MGYHSSNVALSLSHFSPDMSSPMTQVFRLMVKVLAASRLPITPVRRKMSTLFWPKPNLPVQRSLSPPKRYFGVDIQVASGTLMAICGKLLGIQTFRWTRVARSGYLTDVVECRPLARLGSIRLARITVGIARKADVTRAPAAFMKMALISRVRSKGPRALPAHLTCPRELVTQAEFNTAFRGSENH